MSRSKLLIPEQTVSAKSSPEPGLAKLQSGPGNRDLLSSLGGAKTMPGPIQAKMEESIGADFSGVSLYESPLVAQGGAEAAAAGNKIAFAPGKLDFSSSKGLELLGHELSHVASQARGEVAGSGFVNDSSLERKADADGARAASAFDSLSGQTLTPMREGLSAPVSAAAPIQARKKKSAGEQFTEGYHDSKLYDQVAYMRNMALMSEQRMLDPSELEAYQNIISGGLSTEFMDEMFRQQLATAGQLNNVHNYYARPGVENGEDKGMFMADNSLQRPLFQGYSSLLRDIGLFSPEEDDDMLVTYYQGLSRDLAENDPAQNRLMMKANSIATYDSGRSAYAQANPRAAQDTIAAGDASFRDFLETWQRPKKRSLWQRLRGRR